MSAKKLSDTALRDIARCSQDIIKAWNTLVTNGVDEVALHRLITKRKKTATGRPAQNSKNTTLVFWVQEYQSEHPGISDAEAVEAVLKESAERAQLTPVKVKQYVAKHIGSAKVAYSRHKKALQNPPTKD